MREGNAYHATSATDHYSGTLKSVVQSAVADLNSQGGGTVSFTAGDFDLGTDNFIFGRIDDVTFAGQGMGVTTVRNVTDAARDTEPFSFSRSNRITIRDLTVSAGGSARSTSDAVDFDGAVGGLIERVEVTSSRARGIVYDGKDAGRSAEQITIRECVITGGVRSDGVTLLGANDNRVEGCRITDVGGNGIYLTKASANAGQPHKPSNDNVVVGNYIENAGYNGIAVNSGNRNLITNNTVLNSSDDTSSLNGVRIFSSQEIVCDENRVELNRATDAQAVKTQRYGLHISSVNCHHTVIGSNNFAGNASGAILDNGTGTVYGAPVDTAAPSRPTRLRTLVVGARQVDLSWSASVDDVGVAGYDIFRNDSWVATVGNVTVFSDNSAQPTTTYRYHVRAADAAGNLSSPSTTDLATTPTSGTPGSCTLASITDGNPFTSRLRSSADQYGGADKRQYRSSYVKTVRGILSFGRRKAA